MFNIYKRARVIQQKNSILSSITKKQFLETA